MLTRLAPTPSGYLHTGNIYNFLLNWLWARCNSGKVLLRIDDADAGRKRKEYVDDIFRVLDWLGLDWDMGPAGPDDFETNWSQSLRADLYGSLLQELMVKDLVFACNCSRKQPCNCDKKNIPLSTYDTAWKIKVESGTMISFTDRSKGDLHIDLSFPFVIRRKDGIAAYQISSLADDRYFGVSHICRGEDLIPSTAMQLYIDGQLHDPCLGNCSFWHHELLTDDNSLKYSKSAGIQSQSIITQIKKEALLSSFVQWTGWDSCRGMSPREMTEVLTLAQ